MISEFQELSDKIDQLAEMTGALRRENAQLRQANASLLAESQGYQRRLSEASHRIMALLDKVPALDGKEASAPAPADHAEADNLPEKEDVR